MACTCASRCRMQPTNGTCHMTLHHKAHGQGALSRHMVKAHGQGALSRHLVKAHGQGTLSRQARHDIAPQGTLSRHDNSRELGKEQVQPAMK
eukprot:1159063-Pelagomonas_calceolata.AAC.3